MGHRWKPIRDLPQDCEDLRVPSVEALAERWAARRGRVGDHEVVQRLTEQINRRWIIETGQIEGVYCIDRGVTELMVTSGITLGELSGREVTDRPPEEVRRILQDHQDALEGLFDFAASRRPLSTSYIKELHQALLRSQETTKGTDAQGRMVEVRLLKGEWKRQPNNPTRPDGEIHEYCPPEHVASEVDRLVEMHLAHVEASVPPEVEAAWLHHRFTEIHPFQDGNGRVARALASLVLIRAGWFPFVVERDRRGEYIASLEAADDGHLAALVALVAEAQTEWFRRLMEATDDLVSTEERLENRIAERVLSAAAALDSRKLGLSQAGPKLDALSERLCRAAVDLLKQAETQVKVTFEGRLDGLSLGVSRGLYRGLDLSHVAAAAARKLGTEGKALGAPTVLWIDATDRTTRRRTVFQAVVLFVPRPGEYFARYATVWAGGGPCGEVAKDSAVYDSPFRFWASEREQDVVGRFEEWLSQAVAWAVDRWVETL